MLGYLSVIIATVRARIEQIRADERGYSTETVLVTALLVAAAIVVIGIIVAAVTRKANEIGGQM
ncbi:hypothetical protein GCM10012275_59770 [Longimycelium tulufanense]|uniref:Uncharacterized protein n=1 Tax=Longimycelium tulufanense TaxID=907463 RepID=A0A8J3CK09_9PSEU|nr:hypothetical protein [Longimycelium tulufanense]GGM81151.1 hypothetical protein GCM10012275_59770 [Longimycelium tulufanense]